MKNAVPLSQKLLYADAFTDKLFSLLFAVLLFYCPNTHAGTKPATGYRGGHNDDGYTAEVTTATKLPLFAAPTLSYGSPQTYIAGTAVTLTPTSSGVAALGFSSSPTTAGSGFTHPNGVAVDAAGNVYVADAGHNAVKKIPIGGGSPVSIGSGFSNPSGVAVDASGNVYVADAGHNAVKKIPAGGGSTVSIGSGFSDPLAVAVDAAGNVYVADAGNHSIKMIVVGGSTFSLTEGGFDRPSGVAVDVSGTNIYIAESGIGAGIYRIVVTAAGWSTFGPGFNRPVGVSVDDVGNVLVADAGTNIISKIPPNGGSSTTMGSGFKGPTGVVQDAAGNVYVADNTNNAVKKIKPIGGYFISSALPAGLRFNRSTGVISGTPTEASPAKNYVITAYNGSGSKSATVNIKVNLPPAPTISYSSPHTYTVGTAITPLAPTSSHVTAKGYSANPVVLPPGFVFPSTVAKDAAGNVYTLDADNNHVLKTPPGGTQSVYATTSDRPNCVATDAAGNLFVGLYYGNQIEKIPVGGGAHSFIGSGFNPQSIAVDPVGNLFVVDGHSPDNPNGGAVEELFTGGGGTVLTGGSFQPTTVALDTVGNVYVQGVGSEKIKPIGGYYISKTLPAGLAFNNSTGVISGTPTKSSPATVYTITAYNNFSSKSATVSIKVLSKNANLANLQISKGTLTPTFNTNTTSYTASVGNTIQGITVTPTTSNPAATVTVNGETVASGSASSSQPLSAGSNTITVLVTAQNGATKTYTLTVTRAASSISIAAANTASLDDLSLQALTLYPNPNPGGQLNIMLKNYRKQANVTIYLYSMTGIKIKTLNVQTDVNGNYNTVIPIASLGSPKFYVIRTVSDAGVKEGKVIVQ